MNRNKTKSPKLSAAKLVKKLENKKGVKFNIMTRTQAVNFLQNNNYYFRVTSYESNYLGYLDINSRYLHLEFAYLVELSTLDMYLREQIISMCLDIEHCLKVQLLHDIEKDVTENGYDLVNSFLNLHKNSYVINDIMRKSTSAYCGDMIKHYFNYSYDNGTYEFDCPVWAFLEVISFGTFIDFYTYYYNNKPQSNRSHISCFPYVRSLRNACAHNNCILHDLRSSTNTSPNNAVLNFVHGISTIGKNSRTKKLKNRFNLEFVALLYLYSEIVSPNIKKKRIEKMKQFFSGRLQRNMSYFQKNATICTNFDFLKKVVDFL